MVVLANAHDVRACFAINAQTGLKSGA